MYFDHLADRIGRNLSFTLQACFLSLPIAMLLWAAVTFIAAIAAYSIQTISLSRVIGFAILIGLLFVFTIVLLTYFSRIWHRDGPQPEDSNAAKRFISSIKARGEAVMTRFTLALSRIRRRVQGVEGSSAGETAPV